MGDANSALLTLANSRPVTRFGYVRDEEWAWTFPWPQGAGASVRATVYFVRHASFTFIASATGGTDASGTTLDCSSALDVAAGDLLVAWVSDEGATTTVAVAKDSGSPTNEFAFGAGDSVSNGTSVTGRYGYLLSASADATATFRATWTSARPTRSIIVLQFRPTAGATVSRDTGANGSGNSSSASSGNITTTGTDEVVIGAQKLFNYDPSRLEKINTIGADGVVHSIGTTNPSAWYRSVSATFTGAATCTEPVSDLWVCGAIAFKADLPAFSIGTVAFEGSVEAITPGDATDLDSAESFDAVSSSGGISLPAMGGQLARADIVLASVDSVADGDYVRLRLTRDTGISGNALTNVNVLGVVVEKL